jgi:hypothetical protein
MTEDRQKAEFNMAVSYLNRLNILFLTADESAIELDTYTWYHTLLAIYRELSTELKPTEIDEYEKEIARIAPRINLSVHEQSKGRGITTDLYKDLHDFEIRLRRIMRESGLQMKIQEDAAKALR